MKTGWIIAIIGLAFIAAIVIKFITDDIDVAGWRDFKKDIKGEYEVLDNISINSSTPIRTFISFYLNHDCNLEEILPIFEETRKYTASKDVIMDLQKLHKSKFKNNFDEIVIEYSYFDKSSDYYSQFRFSSMVNNDSSLGPWSIERNSKPLGDYVDGKFIKYEAP